MPRVEKITKLNSSTYVVRIPMDVVNKLGISHGDTVYIVEKEKEIRIIPLSALGGSK